MKTITLKEVQEVVFQMKEGTSSGRDGFIVIFFHHFLGDDQDECMQNSGRFHDFWLNFASAECHLSNLNPQM